MTSLVKTTIEQEFGLTPAEVETVRKSICAGAPDENIRLFLFTCKRLKLDHMARQVFLVPRWDSATRSNSFTTQVSIDGFRVVAERSGKYQGQTPVEWCGQDGIWKDVWLSDKPPVAARVGVLREDFKAPLYAVAHYKSYVQTNKEGRPNSMWTKMPESQLAKCAEALALRKAFPNDLSGVYTTDEMGQAANEEVMHAKLEVVQQKSLSPSRKDVVMAVLDDRSKDEEVVEIQEQALKASAEKRIQSMQKIGASATVEELQEFGNSLKMFNLSNGDRKLLQDAYRSKMEWLKKQATEKKTEMEELEEIAYPEETDTTEDMTTLEEAYD